MGSKPEEALPLFAAFFEKRPDLRPTKEYFEEVRALLCPCGRTGQTWDWRLADGSLVQRLVDLDDALAHCVAHLARLVAEAGFTVWVLCHPTYDEALIAAAGELPVQEP